ncbi:hypothetical protein Moror_4525 [Moniliophthora roreri MCA 2997]|uniref:DUF6593 domain-containing protein n=1 Tax=Moniliophthora roreri (strain MCA 2997) TaxID=1381753 RepID=V2X036_MONRO|nr:hypothetical protein Moror_4525 [Moniliophthora roreri MCA 2997]
MSFNPSSSQHSSSGAAPSIYRALSSAGSPPGLRRLVFYPDILNCAVIGPDTLPHYYVVTDSQITILKKTDGTVFGVIEWQNNPTVEIKDLVRKQPATKFLSLASVERTRGMNVNGKQYIWLATPEEIFLYPYPSLQHIARIKRESCSASIILEVTEEAVGQEVLLPCVLSTVLIHGHDGDVFCLRSGL